MSSEIFSARDVAKLLDDQNGKLVGNVSSEAVGHLLGELNNFLCKQVLGEAPGFSLYLGPETERTTAIKELYGSSIPVNFVLSQAAPEMERAISLFRPDLVEDVGISSYKNAPVDGKTVRQILRDDGYMAYVVEPETLAADTASFYRRKSETHGVLSLSREFEMPPELERFIGADGNKTALVSYKMLGGSEYAGTGVARNFDPRSYIPGLEFLRESGFQLIHFGREPYPDCYHDLGVVDYANSEFASFRNDLILASRADFGLFGSSGIASFAEWMEFPFVMINMWTLDAPPFSEKAVYVPTLARERQSGELARFGEQLRFRQNHGVYFPSENYDAVDCSEEDILLATRECLSQASGSVPLTSNQKLYHSIIEEHPTPKYAMSRVSAGFADKYAPLAA